MRTLILVLLCFLTMACLSTTEKQEPLPQTVEPQDAPVPVTEEKAMYEDGPSAFGIRESNIKDGWSVAGQLDARRLDQRITMQVNFPEAGTYTVKLDASPLVIDPDPIGNPYAAQPEAIITWSVEGNSVQRRVSVVSGMAITGTGQGVRVDIVNTYQVPILAGGVANYPVSAQVTKGVRGSDEVPPYWAQDPLGNGAAYFLVSIVPVTDIDIPQGVGIKSVKIIANYSGTYDPAVTAQDALGATFLAPNSASIGTYDPRYFGFVPIRPGAEKIRLRSRVTSVPAGSWNCQIIWGIEG